MSNEDTLKSIGSILAGAAMPPRDAVHIAVAPVRAAHRIRPGQLVTAPSKEGYVEVGTKANSVGIADPFLEKAVNTGDVFWVFLRPGSISGLNHVWQHPDFPDEGEPKVRPLEPDPADLAALKKLCENSDSTFESIMADARVWVLAGRETENPDFIWYNNNPEQDEWDDQDETWEKFWDLYEKVTGEKVGKDKRCSFYTCCV